MAVVRLTWTLKLRRDADASEITVHEPGIDLFRLVQRVGPLPVEDACEYVRQAAHALQHAFERGLVHRDIKPANLLLTEGGDAAVKIIDWGLARCTRNEESAPALRPLTDSANGAEKISLLGTADHNVQMMTDGTLALIPIQSIVDIAFRFPAVGMAMWYETLVEGSIFREWILNVGRRDAFTAIAHLLCEFAMRAEAAEIGQATSYELPLTQEQLADAVGLTPVHVNRTLMSLGKDGLSLIDRLGQQAGPQPHDRPAVVVLVCPLARRPGAFGRLPRGYVLADALVNFLRPLLARASAFSFPLPRPLPTIRSEARFTSSSRPQPHHSTSK